MGRVINARTNERTFASAGVDTDESWENASARKSEPERAWLQQAQPVRHGMARLVRPLLPEQREPMHSHKDAISFIFIEYVP